MKRLNGWQRIGVIISFAWMALACSVAPWPSESRMARVTMRFLDAKYTEVKMPNGIIYDVEHYGDKPTDKEIQAAVGRVKDKWRAGLREPFEMIVFPVIMFWLGAYALIWAARWIAAGFRKEN